MSKLIFTSLRVLIILIALGCLLSQVLFLPLVAAESAFLYPEISYLQYPYLILAILVVVSFQIVLLAIWKLLTFTQKGTIFNQTALGWVKVIIYSGIFATVVSTLTLGHLLFIENLGGPGILLLFLFSATVGSTVVLLMVVMKNLLISASSFKYELENEVV